MTDFEHPPTPTSTPTPRPRPDGTRRAMIAAAVVVSMSAVAGAAALTTIALRSDETAAEAPTTTEAPVDQPGDGQTTTTEPADDPATGSSTTVTEPEARIDPQVVAQLSAMADWATPIAVTTDERAGSISSGAVVDGDQRVETVCRPQGQRLMSTVFTEFPVSAFSGSALPGLVVEGAGIPDGDLRVVPLDRAPLELVSSADSFQNVQVLDAPETSDLQQAVTALKRDADVRLSDDGVDVVAGDITFVKSETHSFEQTTLELGISMHYESMTRSAGFEGTFDLDEAVEQHSIVVRLIQPMFTIRMELDDASSPGDFFAAGVTDADIAGLEAQGRLGADNPPVVIDSVTYGRVMYYTLTSSEVSSASELTAIVDGSYRGVEGEASLSLEQREVLSRSEVQLIAYGGDQQQALAAIREGDLGLYFGPANTATAAPLTMTMRTLDGTPVDVADEATLQEVVCDVSARPYEFRVAVSSIDNGTMVVTTENGGRVGRASEGDYASGVNNILATIPGDLLSWGWNELTFEFTASGPGCSNIFDAEEFEASIRSRPTAGSGEWSTRQGRISFDENECGTRTFSRWVNTTTGEITTTKPAT